MTQVLVITSLKHIYHRRLVCQFQERIRITKECHKVYLFDVSMHAASWNAVRWETIADCYWKKLNEKEADSEVVLAFGEMFRRI
jgi:hypothetical protein